MTLLRFIAKLLFFSALCGEASFAEGPTNNGRDGLIQQAVRSLLGVKETLEPGWTKKRFPEPPRYMLDLYDQYRTGKKSTEGNTVRSILPMRGKFEGVDMLVFNLTGIHSGEQILQCMLHLYKRRKSRKNKRRDITSYRLKIVDLRMQSDPQWVDFSLREKQGWDSYDITKSVTKCRSVKSANEYLLGVTAEVQRQNGKNRPIHLRRVVRLSSQPFLIIFSEDRNNKSEIQGHDENEKRTFGELFRNNIWNSSRDSKSLSLEDILMTRIKRFLPADIDMKYNLLPSTVASEEISSKVTRKIRSLPSNEVPDDSADFFNSSKLTAQDRLLAKYARKIDPNIIPMPHTMKKKKYPLDRKKKRRKNRKLPFWWIRHEGKHITHNTERVCRRKKLVVDFSKIGWSEWVISPNSFEAYYCTGSCSFPLIKNGRPSNHATIQSLVHAFGKGVDIPAPCCVPSTTSSLTMLYFDEDESVILKNYPNMIVESCACR